VSGVLALLCEANIAIRFSLNFQSRSAGDSACLRVRRWTLGKTPCCDAPHFTWRKNESPEGFAFVQIEPVIPVPSRRSR